MKIDLQIKSINQVSGFSFEGRVRFDEVGGKFEKGSSFKTWSLASRVTMVLDSSDKLTVKFKLVVSTEMGRN